MAIQPLNVPQPPSAQQGLQGARSPQPSAQEVQKPRPADQVTVSKEADDRFKEESTRLGADRLADQNQQGATIQSKAEDIKQATAVQNPGRVDLTA